MRFRFKYFPIIGVLIFVGILSVWYFYLTTNVDLYDEGFEQGLGDWVKDADLPLDPNKPRAHFSKPPTLFEGVTAHFEVSVPGDLDDRCRF